MSTDENNQEAVVEPESTEEESNSEGNVVNLSKEEYENLNQTIGSLKRELKDLKKPKETPVENKKKVDVDDSSRVIERLEKLSLQQAGITHPDDIDLAKKTAEKWNMDIEDLVSDADFKLKLERQQTDRSNVDATSNVKGNASTGGAKATAEYWIAKGVPPTKEDVPDRKTRVKIARAFLDSAKSSKKFYND